MKGRHISLEILLKLLTSSSVPINLNQVFILRFLADWVPSVSHLLMFPCIVDIYRVSIIGLYLLVCSVSI